MKTEGFAFQEAQHMNSTYEFLLKQHIGVPSVPVVKAGDEVKRGELIAQKPQGKPGANLFSSVSGTVREVTAESICIAEKDTDFSKYVPLSGENPAELTEESGLVGLGGAGFPTYIKMQTKLTPSGMVIINAAECEPVLTHNISRVEAEPQLFLEALQLCMKMLSVSQGVIAIKSSHQKAVRGLKEALHRMREEHTEGTDGIRIHELPDLYPMGEERAVIREVRKILLTPEELPSAADVVVINAETAFRLYEAVIRKKPLIDKDITVAGKLKENGAVRVLLDVPVGRKAEDVFQMAGGLGAEYGELIMGGPYTGTRTEKDAPVQKTTGGLIAAECFPAGPEKIGLLVCACGAGKSRLEEIAGSMGSTVAGTEYCKQAQAKGNALKCENPGHCPGQAGKVLALKKAGAQALLISNCTDCSNTVMSCAPQLGLPVYHCTDGALRAVNHKLIRRMHTEQDI